MRGKTLSEFIDSLYINPEMEIEYSNKKFLISGYRDDDNSYVLRVDTITETSEQIFFAKNADVQNCVDAFENAKIFDGKTIYEAEDKITVLYG
jgi:hypothetical protein